MDGLSDDAILAYAANIHDLEDAREEAQSDLKDAWGHIREAHGKRFADSLKLAVKRARMGADKRQQADEIDVEADRILALMNAGPRVRVARGAREEEVPHDADGVVIDDEIPAAVLSAQLNRANSETPAVAAAVSETADNPVANVGEGANGAEAVASVDPASREADGADRQQPATSGFTGDGEVASAFLPTNSESASLTPSQGIAEPGGRSAVIPAAAPVTEISTKKRWTFNDPAHRDCLDPGMCGGFSNLKLCQRCREASAMGQVA